MPSNCSDLRERAGGAERTILGHVVDVHAERVAVAEVADDRLRQIVRGDAHRLDSRVTQPLQRALQQRPIADRKHRLRHVIGQRPQPRAESARHDHRRHRRRIQRDEIAPQQEADDAAVVVDERKVIDREVRAVIHQVQRLGGRRRRRRGDRRAARDAAARAIERLVAEDRAADVAVGQHAGQPAVFAAQQQDARLGVFEPRDGFGDRGVGRKEHALEPFGGWLHRHTVLGLLA